MEKLESIRKFALKNALEHDGKASPGAIIGKLIAEDASVKDKMKEFAPAIARVVGEVNKLSLEGQLKELKEKHPEMLEKKKEEKRELPELENALTGKVVMRMAPNPNGPLHFGNTRAVILNDEYVKKYKGTFILRFDDTDPKNENKRPMKEAYDWIPRQLEWLGVEVHRVERASARLQRYYEAFSTLLRMGAAYVCSCPQEEWGENVRVKRLHCPCRSLSAEENLERWRKMLSWDYREGQAVGRMKTPEGEKDPAVIDWPTFRTVDEPQHPYSQEHVWPMLDFASAIDDHDFGVTHILRGKDLIASEKKQLVLYNYMNWAYPKARVYGKVFTTDDMIISKSKIVEGIRNGLYSGWDDPRLAVLDSFKKRGIQPQAIRNYILNLGVGEHETTLDLDILYKENRRLLDAQSNRYFAVMRPQEIQVTGLKETKAEAPLHPDDEARGKRTIEAVNGKVYVDAEDLKHVKAGEAFRLLHLCNASMHGQEARVRESRELPGKKLHWVPVHGSVPVEVVMPNGSTLKGFAEKTVLNEKPDSVVQFERFGFCRIDSVSGQAVKAYYCHP